MITINNQKYNPNDLSEDAKAHVAHLSYIDGEIRRCQMNINVLNIARRKIGEMLSTSLPATGQEAAAPEPEPVVAPAPVAPVLPESKAKTKAKTSGKRK